MQRTDIEWVINPNGTKGYTSNPMKGYCPVACSYCYARSHYDRFKLDKTLRYSYDEVSNGLAKLKESSTIFVGSTFELFGDWTPAQYLMHLFRTVRSYPQHTFIFLSKNPLYLVKLYKFPPNCHIGCTVTTPQQYKDAMFCMSRLIANVKFISFEPLLEELPLNIADFASVNWVIAGGMTGTIQKLKEQHLLYPQLSLVKRGKGKFALYPEKAWVDGIVEITNALNIPLFIKENLQPMFDCKGKQQLPTGYERKPCPDIKKKKKS